MKLMYREYKEKLVMFVAWRLPKSLVYWCAIRVGANATQGEFGNESPTDLNFVTALKRW